MRVPGSGVWAVLVATCVSATGAGFAVASAPALRGAAQAVGQAAPSGGTNPFGVMLPSRLARTPQGAQLARALGAVYFRPDAIFLDRYDGSCPSCEEGARAGLKLVLTVRATGPGPTAPPADLAAYRDALGRVLDRWRPAILVVENEESSALFYTGTPAAYETELQAACEVARRRGIPCANGGLVSSLVALLVYDYYRQAGQSASSADFAARALSDEQRRQIDSARGRELLARGRALLQAYQRVGVDFVNFHWYVADPRALGEAVAYLRAHTGRPVITNEVGQFTDDPAQTEAVMAVIVRAGLPVAVWFGLDGPHARGLVNPDGSLRPTGEAFRRFIVQTFGSSGTR